MSSCSRLRLVCSPDHILLCSAPADGQPSTQQSALSVHVTGLQSDLSPPQLQSFKPSDKHFHEVKVAQLLTVLRDQGVKEGVTKREARRAER